jgi:hypothetical protein
MPRSSASKFAENPFLSGTVGRFPLMGELLADALPRAGIWFLPGIRYELWLCGANSRGRSGPGPVVMFTGV